MSKLEFSVITIIEEQSVSLYLASMQEVISYMNEVILPRLVPHLVHYVKERTYTDREVIVRWVDYSGNDNLVMIEAYDAESE